MIYIQKPANFEPKELTEYKKMPGANYENFREKNAVKKGLLKEQGYLCAYCMSRIGEDEYNIESEVRIEHYNCQDDHPDLQLQYSNMLAVCTTTMGKSPKDQTCDVKKGNAPIFINPQNSHHISTIRYNKTGEISSIDSQFAEDLTKTLGLNNGYLPANRREVLHQVICEMISRKPKEGWSDDFLTRVIKIYKRHNEKGKLRPFCGIVISYLEKKLGLKVG